MRHRLIISNTDCRNTFRRIRDDETLAEEIVFELGPNGEVLRFVQHSNYSERIR